MDRGGAHGPAASGAIGRRRKVVTAVVGVILTLGAAAAAMVPRFLQFRMRARMSELKSNFGAIRSTMVAHYAEWNAYPSSFSQLGFAPEGATLCRYTLELPRVAPAKSRPAFTVRAECDLDGDGKPEILTWSDGDTEIRQTGDNS